MNTVRRATTSDIPRILELLVQVDMVHHNGRPDLFKGPATKYNAAQLEKIVQDDTTPVFVCVAEDGRIAGHGFCVHKQIVGDAVLTDVRTLYIDDICVDASARGEHVGTALYKAVKDIARSLGCHNITLRVWEFNGPAVSFYEKMGMGTQARIMEEIL